MTNRRTIAAVLATASLLPLAAAHAQTGACARTKTMKAAGPTTGPVTPAEVCRVLSVLASDSLEGRGTATPGGLKAARFIAAEFKAAGLEPAGDSGTFLQAVPVVLGTRGTRTGPMAVASFADRDTFPVERRLIAYNVVGVLRGSDPVLKDSVVLVDAHYDHLGLRRDGGIDVDSMRAWVAAATPIQAERDAWIKASGVNMRAGRRGGAVPDSIRTKLQEFSTRLSNVRVNMDSIRRVHPTARRDSIYNGADDDAAGTTAVIEIAKQLARGARPKRTIVFAATTGEEVGLIGTNWYIKHPVMPLASMEANLEIEMIGRPDSLAGGPGRAWLTGFERSTMGDMFAKAGLAVVPDKRQEQQFFQRSDNIAFARMGIPAHTLSTFNLHTDYHQVTDDVSLVDFAHMAGVINIGVKAVGLLGNGPAPQWNAGGKP
jgi:hypothetical protein